MDKQDIIRFAGYLSALYDVLTPIFYLLLLLLMLCFFLPDVSDDDVGWL